jgi:peptidoglycan/xylan/chitin deacetylase (PgdA/CDA1 family)
MRRSATGFLFALSLLGGIVLAGCIGLPRRSFDLPVVAITFDDAHPSVYAYAFPTMHAIDSTWGATHFLPVTYALPPEGTITVAHLREMEAAGWETGGHGFTHENLSSVPLDSAELQVKESYDFLRDSGLSHESFAYPWGNYNDAVAAIVGKYFSNIRTSHDFQYLDGIDRQELGYFAVKPGCTSAEIIERVEEARNVGSPLVIIGFHALLPDSAAPISMYWCRESAFREFLLYLKQREYPVLTIKQAMKALCGNAETAAR